MEDAITRLNDQIPQDSGEMIQQGPVCKNVILNLRFQEVVMENGANEVMYKMASNLLKKMQKNGLISEEEKEKIDRLNLETFSPKLAEVYM